MRINYEIELLSSALTAETGTIGKDIDIVMKLDKNGNPYFPASHIKGILRSRFSSFEKALYGENSDLASNVFGKSGNNTSKIRMSNAVLSTISLDTYEKQLAFRHGIRMNRKTRTTEANSLFSYEFVSSGRKFLGSITLDETTLSEKEIKLLKGSLLNLDRIGGMKSRGLGLVNVTLSEEKEKSETLGKNPSKLEKYSYKIELEENLILKSREMGNIISVRSDLQGSTIRGALIEELLGAGADIRELLDIKVSEPRNGEMNTFVSTFKSKYKIGKEYEYRDKVFFTENKVNDIKLERASSRLFSDIVSDVSIEIDNRSNSAREGQLFTSEIIRPSEKENTLTGTVELSSECMKYLNGKTILLGKKKSKGFGKCKISFSPYIDNKTKLAQRINRKEYKEMNLVTFTAMSDIVLPYNEIYDIHGQFLAMINIDSNLVSNSEKTFLNFDKLPGYNIVNGIRKSDELIIKKGSVISFTGNVDNLIQKLEAVEASGVGIRKSEGFGEIEICSPKHLREGK